MTERNLNWRIQMRHDTLQNWENNNPILLAGEVGVAIDSETGICTIKIGDGVHHWRDLTLVLGQKEHSNTYSQSYAIGNYSTIKGIATTKPSGYSYAVGSQSIATGQKVTTIEAREKPARSQPKDLRSELKTLSRAIDGYNLTEVHSDIDFDF